MPTVTGIPPTRVKNAWPSHRIKLRHRTGRCLSQSNQQACRHDARPTLARLAVKRHHVVLVHVEPSLRVLAKVHHGLQGGTRMIREGVPNQSVNSQHGYDKGPTAYVA